MPGIQIIFPERSDDELSDGLLWLTERVCIALGESGSGGLGGTFGYGENYENEVFAMHRNCWCDREDCPWCSYSYEHGRYFQEVHRARGALPGIGSGAAPNFWHKPTGFKVWWYKWIGRDNEVSGECDLKAMLAECVASLPLPNRTSEQ